MSVFGIASPEPATASPVNALSSEMTIGTSAPPTGSTSSTPSSSPTASSGPPNAVCPVTAVRTARTAAATATSPMTSGAAGRITGREVISPWSLRNVTTEPDRAIAPATTANADAAFPRAVPLPAHSASSMIPTTAAAPPPAPLNTATSCGMSVIRTRRASGTATTDPTTTAPSARARLSAGKSTERKTTTTASAAPSAPSRLPRTAVRGELRPLSARMKHTAAAR